MCLLATMSARLMPTPNRTSGSSSTKMMGKIRPLAKPARHISLNANTGSRGLMRPVSSNMCRRQEDHLSLCDHVCQTDANS